VTGGEKNGLVKLAAGGRRNRCNSLIMVKLFAIAVLNKQGASANHLAIAKDVSSFGFFQRGTVTEFLSFFSQTLAERTAQNTRQSVKEQEYLCHVHARGDGLVGVIVADEAYPSRVAFTLISKVLDEFSDLHGPEKWDGKTETPFPKLTEHLKLYQNPDEADSLSKIHKDLDETKIILIDNIEQLMNRGEKLDDLVTKSEGLSSSAKMFYKQSRKANSCCIVM